MSLGSLAEGEVLAVVKENNRFTGTVETIEGRLALVPDACPHCPIYIKKSADGGARDGEKAAVEILERGDSHEDHRAGVAMPAPMAAGLQCLIHFQGAFLGRAPHGEFHGQHRDAQDQQENQVDHDERAAAILPGHPRKFPYVADADGASGAEENEA